MQVSVTNVGGLERQVTVVLPAKQMEEGVITRLKKMAKGAKVAGFRPGKAPLEVLQKLYEDSVRQEVLQELMQASLYEALQQEHLAPAGQPHIISMKSDKGQDVEFTAAFEIYPEITLAPIEGIAVEKIVANVTEKDIQEVLDNLRRQYATWEEVDRPAVEGDKLRIDFVGSIDGVKFEGGTAKNVDLTLGSGKMIPGFESGLIGVKTGDERTITVTFPEQYPAKELAGKPAQFAIKTTVVSAPQLPPIDDALAQKLGVKQGGIEELRKEIQTTLERELKRTLSEKLKQQVMDKVLELNPVDLPKYLVENEAMHLQQQTIQQIQMQIGNKTGFKPPSLELFQEKAKRRVGLGLLLPELVKKLGISLEEARVKTKAEEVAGAYENPEEVVAWYYADKQRLSELKAAVLEDQVVDKLLERARIVEKAASYCEIMHPEHQH